MLEHMNANDNRELVGYAAINGAWGSDPSKLRKPTDKEAIKACRLLLAEGFRAYGKPQLARQKRKFKITSGRRHTWPRHGVWNVNPDSCGRGFAEIVHAVSHWVHRRVNPGLARQRNGGHNGHAQVEAHLVKFVLKKRWIEDGMKIKEAVKVAPSKDDKLEARKAKLQTRLAKWRTKQKRATTAIRKIEKSLKCYK